MRHMNDHIHTDLQGCNLFAHENYTSACLLEIIGFARTRMLSSILVAELVDNWIQLALVLPEMGTPDSRIDEQSCECLSVSVPSQTLVAPVANCLLIIVHCQLLLVVVAYCLLLLLVALDCLVADGIPPRLYRSLHVIH